MSFSYSPNDFKEATPINTYVKMALAGPPNSGKTVSALRLAAGFGGETAVIDTQNKRAMRYANAFKFRHFDLQPPFSGEHFGAAINAAAKAGFNNIIVDAMSDEHEGPGGLLDYSHQFQERKTADIEDGPKRDKAKEKYLMSSLIVPKMQRTNLIQFGISRLDVNFILCFRAKPKIKMVKEKWENASTGKSGEKNVPTDQGIQPIGGNEFWGEMNIVAIMDEGSKGAPDWEEQACRINEFPPAELTAYLHSVKQFDEECGRRLVEFNTPVRFILKTKSAEKAYPTMDRWRAAAAALVSKITPEQKAELISLNPTYIAEFEKMEVKL
jgi:hypothetical protein